MTRTYLVTPTLYVGEPPMRGGTEVTTVQEALDLIHRHEVAVLPHGHWGTVRDVLLALGVDTATVSERIYYARFASFPPRATV